MTPYREAAIPDDRCPEPGCHHRLALHDDPERASTTDKNGQPRKVRCHVIGCHCGRKI